jgi:hypothetical protein
MARALTYLVRVRAEWNTECARETEVGELEVVPFVDEQVLRLEIAVQNPVRVAVEQAGRQLVRKFLRW